MNYNNNTITFKEVCSRLDHCCLPLTCGLSRLVKVSPTEFDIVLTKAYENFKDSPNRSEMRIDLYDFYENVLIYVFNESSNKLGHMTKGYAAQYTVPALKGFRFLMEFGYPTQKMLDSRFESLMGNVESSDQFVQAGWNTLSFDIRLKYLRTMLLKHLSCRKYYTKVGSISDKDWVRAYNVMIGYYNTQFDL